MGSTQEWDAASYFGGQARVNLIAMKVAIFWVIRYGLSPLFHLIKMTPVEI